MAKQKARKGMHRGQGLSTSRMANWRSTSIREYQTTRLVRAIKSLRETRTTIDRFLTRQPPEYLYDPAYLASHRLMFASKEYINIGSVKQTTSQMF